MLLTPDLVRQLRAVDTCTICNALELAMENRDQDFSRGTLVAAPQPLPSIVGFARTVRIAATAPSKLPAAEARQLRLDYYRYVASSPDGPAIVVLQDIDEQPGTGSFWGEVHSAVHKGLGLAGVLTNGSVRDLAELAPDFPILAGSIGPSHASVHVEDFGGDIEVFGLRVAHGDLLHADRHGAVRIPPEHLAALPECIARMQRKEAPLLAAARSRGFDIAMLEAAIRAADDIH